MLLLLGVSVAPMIVTASIIDGQNKAAQGFNEPTARRSQNVEIAPATVPVPDSVEPKSSFQLVINVCGNRAGNANLRAGEDVIGIISSGTVVNLTGKTSGEWVEVSGAYWPTGAEHPTTGTGWVHKCWMTP